MIRRPGNTSSDTRTSKPGSGNWRRSWSSTDRADHSRIEDPLLWEKLSIFLPQILIPALKEAVEGVIEDGVVSIDEENSLSRYLDHFNLTTGDMSATGTHTSVVQARSSGTSPKLLSKIR